MLSLAQNVKALATKNKELARKYLKPLVVSVFSYQDGARWEATPSTAYPFKHQHIAVWSYSQLLTRVSRRIYSLSNLAKRMEPIRYNKDLDGRSDNRRDAYTHVVMQSVGLEPKLLLASENIFESKNGQILLGYIYRTLDPSGTNLAWWKGGRQNFLKYHAFKYTKKVARTPDGKDYYKVFSILEDRGSGNMTVVPCAGTESVAPVDAANAAQKACLKQFQRDTNPARSAKDVRGVFVSGTSFIFSKYEADAHQATAHKGEIPAYGTLGRFLLQRLPAEFASPEDFGSLAQYFPTEGLLSQGGIRLAYSSVSAVDGETRLTARRTQKHSIGALEEELQDKDFWLNIETDANFDKARPKNTGFIFVESAGNFYPVATNAPGTAIDSREALIAIGGLLGSGSTSVEGPRAIFGSCLDQSAFDGHWNIIYEDVTSGRVKREACSFCDSLYERTKQEALQQNALLATKDRAQQDKFIEGEFAKAFAEHIRVDALTSHDNLFKHGASLLNPRQEFVVSADGAAGNEVYFALGKYGQTYCKQLAGLQSATEIGVAGELRRAT